MLYINYEQFMEDIQRELDITLPEYNRYSGYYDDKNYISCNRKSDDLIFMEIALKHNEDHSKRAVSLRIPFEIVNKQIELRYPINNIQIQDSIHKVNDYLPVYDSIEIAERNGRTAKESYYTSHLLISAEIVITKNLEQSVSYLLDDIYFDIEICYAIGGHYNRDSVQLMFRKVDEKLSKNLYADLKHYNNLAMVDRVRVYNIAQHLIMTSN